ncbi:hypothetical protein EJ05DRAFT_519686 [Pseudovirgaria hyperparasitica]|uniref:Uncharacterized protein n=1 Tax=Pseudovirgaria hyperparasitica TaxID=470096 RepID=A0A6A6VYZ7_9PEZI|nr:uncharacterized protein EJ05DRAFT_519686 [Pseudovirgaria hyperparasitica]KAF2754974.1 hypothetical protein EJ05DRAFT_519686 [Pseudovirgaria hyperparasitica]
MSNSHHPLLIMNRSSRYRYGWEKASTWLAKESKLQLERINTKNESTENNVTTRFQTKTRWQWVLDGQFWMAHPWSPLSTTLHPELGIRIVPPFRILDLPDEILDIILTNALDAPPEIILKTDLPFDDKHHIDPPRPIPNIQLLRVCKRFKAIGTFSLYTRTKWHMTYPPELKSTMPPKPDPGAAFSSIQHSIGARNYNLLRDITIEVHESQTNLPGWFAQHLLETIELFATFLPHIRRLHIRLIKWDFSPREMIGMGKTCCYLRARVPRLLLKRHMCSAINSLIALASSAGFLAKIHVISRYIHWDTYCPPWGMPENGWIARHGAPVSAGECVKTSCCAEDFAHVISEIVNDASTTMPTRNTAIKHAAALILHAAANLSDIHYDDILLVWLWLAHADARRDMLSSSSSAGAESDEPTSTLASLSRVIGMLYGSDNSNIEDRNRRSVIQLWSRCCPWISKAHFEGFGALVGGVGW